MNALCTFNAHVKREKYIVEELFQILTTVSLVIPGLLYMHKKEITQFQLHIFQIFRKLAQNKFMLLNMISAFCVCLSLTLHPIENRRIQ